MKDSEVLLWLAGAFILFWFIVAAQSRHNPRQNPTQEEMDYYEECSSSPFGC